MSTAAAMLREARLLAPILGIDDAISSDLLVVEATDFVTGGRANFARAADMRGSVLAAWKREPGEERGQFLERADREARERGARRLLIGGVPNLVDHVASEPVGQQLPHSVITLPDGALHPGQIEALRVIQANRFVAIRAGRRFGKSSLCSALSADIALLGGMAGLFAPIYKLASPLFDTLAATLAPVIATSNRSFGELRLVGGGGCDVWSLEHSRAGRGRRYGLCVIDEASFGTPELTSTWNASIRPTLADSMGSAIVASTPAGIAEDNFFWLVCCESSFGFKQFVAPTLSNPHIPREEIEALRKQHNVLIFSQEFEAEFVNLSGTGLFDVAAMLNAGEPWEEPKKFDLVFAALDSGIKGGQAHDASAIIYFGFNKYIQPLGLFVLDWQAVELGAGDLELWFANCGRRLAEYAERSRSHPNCIYIENAGLGEMLLAKSRALGVAADEIPSTLVSRGKDLRALGAERYINGGQVRLTKAACDQLSKLKGVNRNHLLAQTANFRVADKEAWKRSDDLIDCLVYGALLGFNVE
jgi:hypothetical protein